MKQMHYTLLLYRSIYLLTTFSMCERMSLGGCSPLLMVLILFWMQSLPMVLMALTVSLYPSASRGCRYCRGF